jgi:hypothetical protein
VLYALDAGVLDVCGAFEMAAVGVDAECSAHVDGFRGAANVVVFEPTTYVCKMENNVEVSRQEFYT